MASAPWAAPPVGIFRFARSAQRYGSGATRAGRHPRQPARCSSPTSQPSQQLRVHPQISGAQLRSAVPRPLLGLNLVCENSIEHGILHLLGQKQALAEGVLDGCGDIDALKLPSGRAAMVERMQAMLTAADATAPRIVTADEAIAEELR